MLIASQILVRTFALALCAASLAACGQRGPLFLPTAPEAAQRASLPETLRPRLSADTSGVAAPSLTEPDVATPDVATPDVSTPDVSTPDAETLPAPQQPSSGR